MLSLATVIVGMQLQLFDAMEAYYKRTFELFVLYMTFSKKASSLMHALFHGMIMM